MSALGVGHLFYAFDTEAYEFKHQTVLDNVGLID
jgi:hypothetical protein